jgi:dimethylargininase
MFTRAITRTPAENFAEGLTTVDLGIPDYLKALAAHSHYLDALKQCGLTLIELPADRRFPDSTFVEDTVILLEDFHDNQQGAILTHPGAESRAGEVERMEQVLNGFYSGMARIHAPGSLDGGDICQAGSHFFIGISLRTNEEGGRQLAAWLSEMGFSSSFIDIRQVPGILHLKSGIAYIGDNRLVVIDSLAAHPAFSNYELVHVTAGEEYAANCIRVNETILIAAGFPKLESDLRKLGYKLISLDMEEFQKMDGGLSCLSVRF